MRRIPAILILILILFSFCQKKEEQRQSSQGNRAVANSILKFRAEKDSALMYEKWSPLLSEDKTNFQGLKYYPIDLSLRFEGQIIKYQSTTLDTVIGTKGDLRPALKYGYFPFVYRNKKYKLQIFKILREDPEDQKYLFLGFTDKTSGTETYGAGRYIDLTENEQNHYVVDFNLAYNPYCAYNSRYTCAIPSEENHLPFPVRAGERIFKTHK
ncbi:MAG TPA: DUF1684 domain-containing protein [Caldithrix sp.]|nr:DUF1684 domain-containing protein [Caldithrix sp.]